MTGVPGSVPAPELREVAMIWWEVDADPAVTWDADGRTFWLIDPSTPSDPSRRLELATFTDPVPDARTTASVLAEGLAACDFPPTEERASYPRVRAALRAAGAADQADLLLDH